MSAFLYKYFPPSRAAFFKDRLLRFTPPGVFNDPLEFNPRFLGMEGRARDWVKSVMDRAPSDQTRLDPIGSLSDEVRILIGDKQCLLAWTNSRLVALQRNQDVASALFYFWAAIESLVRKNWLDFANSMGVLCLSENPCSSVMWSHYAADHTGFLVSFDVDTLFFRGETWKASPQNHFVPVSYSAERPVVSPCSMDDSAIFTKSIEWAYECEWRFCVGLSEADKTVVAGGAEIHLFEVPWESIAGVTFGLRASDELKETVSGCLTGCPDREFIIGDAILSDIDYKIGGMPRNNSKS